MRNSPSFSTKMIIAVVGSLSKAFWNAVGGEQDHRLCSLCIMTGLILYFTFTNICSIIKLRRKGLELKPRPLQFGGEENRVKKIEVEAAKPYVAPKHFNMTALRLHGREESGAQRFWVGLSYFLPGGGAEYDSAPAERVYFVLEGEMTVISAEGKIKLKAWDSIYIGPGEGRELINETNKPAAMLVIMAQPD
ncbi:cupin domain-containing protein [Moorellaceae bacterium AZ2]